MNTIEKSGLFCKKKIIFNSVEVKHSNNIAFYLFVFNLFCSLLLGEEKETKYSINVYCPQDSSTEYDRHYLGKAYHSFGPVLCLM